MPNPIPKDTMKTEQVQNEIDTSSVEPMKTEAEMLAQFREKFTSIEFLHGVPVSLPDKTQKELEAFLQEAWQSAERETARNILDVIEDKPGGVGWSRMFNERLIEKLRSKYALTTEAEKEYRWIVELYDKDDFLKSVEKHESEYFATFSGKNWTMLTKGNHYKIARLKSAEAEKDENLKDAIKNGLCDCHCHAHHPWELKDCELIYDCEHCKPVEAEKDIISSHHSCNGGNWCKFSPCQNNKTLDKVIELLQQQDTEGLRLCETCMKMVNPGHKHGDKEEE